MTGESVSYDAVIYGECVMKVLAYEDYIMSDLIHMM